MININNRRYIGSKTKLVDIIYEEVTKRMKGSFSFWLCRELPSNDK